MKTLIGAVAVAGITIVAALTAPSAHADQMTACTVLQICYCVDADLGGVIEQHVGEIRKLIRTQRDRGKAIGYVSVPISTLEGSYFGVNIETADDVKARVEARFGANAVWMLNPGAKEFALPARATGADYMLMWTRVLEGGDGLGPDFDFVYFVGPADFARVLKLTGQGDMEQLEAYYDAHAATDPELRKIDKRKFRNYYALRASVAFSLGSHDEWNIVRAINERRRAADPVNGIGRQLGVFFDGAPAAPGLFDAPVSAGNAGACRVK